MASNKPLKRSISLDNSKFPVSDTEDANSENIRTSNVTAQSS